MTAGVIFTVTKVYRPTSQDMCCAINKLSMQLSQPFFKLQTCNRAGSVSSSGRLAKDETRSSAFFCLFVLFVLLTVFTG